MPHVRGCVPVPMKPLTEPRFWWSGLWPLLPIVAIAAMVRLAVIGRDALWLDEGYSWWDASQTLSALWSVVPQCDPHPPLYFVLLHGWIGAFGDGTLAMRTLSLIFGCATLVAVFMAGRELDRWRREVDDPIGIGPLAALLFALTPFQIYFSIEARPYALLCLAAASMTWGALRLVRTTLHAVGTDVQAEVLARISRSGWWLLVIGAAVALWTNNTAVLLVGALSAFFVLWWLFDRGSRGSIVTLLAAGLAVGLIWAPDLPLLLQQTREVAGDFWILPPNYQRLRFELHYLVGLDNYEATWWMVLAMVGGALLVGRRIAWRGAAMLLAMAMLPVAFNLAISAWMSPILISRTLIGVTPAFVVALAAGAVLLRMRGVRLAATVALVVAHALAAAAFLAAGHIKEPWKPVVARLATLTGTRPCW